MDAVVAWLDQTRAGDVASVLGLLVALIGFAVTIWNVRASRAAAVRAEQAANEARRAIRFFDAVAELSTAIAAMEEIRRLHRDAAWPLLPDRYSLITIRRLNPSTTSQQQVRIQAAIHYLAYMEREVEVALEQRRAPTQTAWWNEWASRHVMELHSLLLDMKDQAGGS